MASCASTPGVGQEMIVIQGYLHNVFPVTISDKKKYFFNCTLQTSRDIYRTAVVFSADKHESFQQAADNHTPLKLSNVKRSTSNGGAFYVINFQSKLRLLNSIDFDYNKEPTFTVKQVFALKPKQKVGKIEAKVVWLENSSKMVKVHGKMLQLKDCHVADHTSKIKLQLWGGLIGQVKQDESYVLKDLSVRGNGELYLTSTKNTTIRISGGEAGEEQVVKQEEEEEQVLKQEEEEEEKEEEVLKELKQEEEEEQEVKQVLKPEEEEEQDLVQELKQEMITTVRGPVCGIQLAAQRQCSHCHKGQLAFNLTDINHRCEACGLLQRVGSYVQAATGKVVVNKGDVKLTLKLTSTVLMTYLSQNNLQELLADVQLVEGYFLEVGLFVIQYNANNEVVVVTTGDV